METGISSQKKKKKKQYRIKNLRRAHHGAVTLMPHLEERAEQLQPLSSSLESRSD